MYTVVSSKRILAKIFFEAIIWKKSTSIIESCFSATFKVIALNILSMLVGRAKTIHRESNVEKNINKFKNKKGRKKRY
jgi:hypothetical protein